MDRSIVFNVNIFRSSLLLVVLLLVLICIAGASTLTVNVSGGEDFTTIQNAIDNASAGDTILVHTGIYYENINVNKKLTLIGLDTGGYTPVVDSRRIASGIFLNADEIVLEGFNATNSSGMPDAGIRVNSNNNIINNNTPSNNEYGIFFDSSRNNTMKGNFFFKNDYAIYLNSSENNTLIENKAINGDYCIYLIDSNNNTISTNTARSNSWNGIRLISSNYNSVNGNNVSENLYGIRLDSSDGNMIGSNNLSDNYYGIRLDSSSGNILDGNVINFSGWNGFRLYNSFYNTMKNNRASNNYYGIYMYYSNNNNIYNNYFNNTNNSYFYDETFFINPNYWNIARTSGTSIAGGGYLGGNFWARPDGTGFSQTCIDDDGEGICDTSYVLTYENVDHLPLTFPKGYINGTVLDNATKTAIEGAIVSIIADFSIRTNESGFYSLFLKKSTYDLVATSEPEYYPNDSVEVTVNMNTTVLQDIELNKKPTGTITGIARKAQV